MTFIVRLTVDGTGAMTGVVERVMTGEKHRFQSLDAMRDLIAAMAVAPVAAVPEDAPS